MNDMARTGETGVLDGLAREARFYAENCAQSMVQLGRVLTQAKPLMPHGQWQDWVRENAGCSLRYAQLFMQVYERFGQNPAISQVKERSKIFKLLALPREEEERFFENNDLEAMSGKEIEEAVARARREMEEKLEKERISARREEAMLKAQAEQARDEREKALIRARSAEEAARDARMELGRALAEEKARAKEEIEKLKEERGMPEEAARELAEYRQKEQAHKAELEKLADIQRETLEEMRRLKKENADLRRDMEEQEAMLDDSQRQYDAIRGELLTLQSAAAKGDAERTPADGLTAEAFGSHVRQFIGACARMPHMGRAFAHMAMEEREEYDQLLLAVESWVEGARRAINTLWGDMSNE